MPVWNHSQSLQGIAISLETNLLLPAGYSLPLWTLEPSREDEKTGAQNLMEQRLVALETKLF